MSLVTFCRLIQKKEEEEEEEEEEEGGGGGGGGGHARIFDIFSRSLKLRQMKSMAMKTFKDARMMEDIRRARM